MFDLTLPYAHTGGFAAFYTQFEIPVETRSYYCFQVAKTDGTVQNYRMKFRGPT
jgi:hypothetical protein